MSFNVNMLLFHINKIYNNQIFPWLKKMNFLFCISFNLTKCTEAILWAAQIACDQVGLEFA